MVKTGNGILELSAVNSYTGGTTVNAGTLKVSANNGIRGNLTINSGGTVLASGADNTLWSVDATTINSGGTLTGDGSVSTHLLSLTLNGGTLASSAVVGGSSAANWGTFNLDQGVTTTGSDKTSVISAQNVALTQSGGTIFNVASGSTASGIDLLVSGTIADASSVAPYTTSLIKQGTGVMQMTGANTFTKATIVSAGTLKISGGSLASLTTSIQSGATLVNNGTLAGTTTIQSGATVAGNNGTFNNLALKQNAFYTWNLSNVTGTAGTGWDELNVGGNLDLTDLSAANQLTIKINSLGVPANFNLYTGLYTFDFLSVAGSINGFNASNFAFDTTGFTAPDGALNGGSWSVGVDGNALALTYAVPEPSTYALFGLGALALVIAARRKRAA